MTKKKYFHKFLNIIDIKKLFYYLITVFNIFIIK